MANTFWEDFGSEGKTYQMGERPERMETIKLLQEYDCQSVLDVGCGTGPIYEIIKNHSLPISYKGVDYSSTFTKTNKTNFPETPWDTQDARDLKEADNSWDAVIMLHSLDHVDDYVKAIKEAIRVSKKVVIICLWRPFVPRGSGNNLNSKNKDFEDTHICDYDQDELEIAMEGHLVKHYELGSEKFNYFYILK